jgi:uncharacterized protein
MRSAKPNRLISEKSPYLLQHARNPVDWYPWGAEAIAKAKNDGKPIFLSIGYSTCHWCHVMEAESFEDDKTAAFLNKHFIPIKVDREERPEVDGYYMAAVQAMTGGGGWPLSVFVTPGLLPFYGGTYFPPTPRSGMPSFTQVLEFVAGLWRDKREDVVKSSAEVAQLARERLTPSGAGEVTPELLQACYAELMSNFDREHGGFGAAPKFPLPSYVTFLLRFHRRTGKELALASATRTLDRIAAGGIRDHLGGGFHRYSTDRTWLVPHFEKMLYDNALLVRAYTESFQVSGKVEHAAAARETLRWMLREMRAEDGGFYSAQDADTPEGEGVFYTWTPDEVGAVLGEADSKVFCFMFGVTNAGNFGGSRTILTLAHQTKEVSARFGLDEAALERKVREWKAALLAARGGRPRPSVDDKVLASWNGLAVSALAYAGRVFGEEEYLDAADRTADFVGGSLMQGGRLLRRFAGGEAALEGTLEDYAFVAAGLLDLFEARGDPRRLGLARSLVGTMVEELWDDGGGFVLARGGLPSTVKDAYDGPTPSGNSVAAAVLLRLSELTGDLALRARAEETARAFAGELAKNPAGHTAMLAAVDGMVNGTMEVVVSSRTAAQGAELFPVLDRSYLPEASLLRLNDATFSAISEMSRLADGKRPGNAPLAYVCRGFTCRLPAKNQEALAAELGAARE